MDKIVSASFEEERTTKMFDGLGISNIANLVEPVRIPVHRFESILNDFARGKSEYHYLFLEKGILGKKGANYQEEFRFMGCIMEYCFDDSSLKLCFYKPSRTDSRTPPAKMKLQQLPPSLFVVNYTLNLLTESAENNQVTLETKGLLDFNLKIVLENPACLKDGPDEDYLCEEDISCRNPIISAYKLK